MSQFERVAGVQDLPPGKGMKVEVNDKQIALFNVDGEFYAVGHVCPHRGGPLAEGNLRGTTITCPWHGDQFNVTDGQLLSPPATTPIDTYPTKVEENDVWVAIG